MPMGKGYWLVPDDNKLYLVGRHEEWLLDPRNQKAVNLPQHVVAELERYRAQMQGPGPRPIDEIRLVGIRAGLVRIRDYLNYIAIQFDASRTRMRNVLWAIYMALDSTVGPHSEVVITNLRTNDSAGLTWKDFQYRLINDEVIMREVFEPLGHRDNIPMDRELYQRVSKAFEKARQTLKDQSEGKSP